MKALTECCYGTAGGCVTPWCSMISKDKRHKCLLHLWWKLDYLQREIEKRSSYLGKFRRTEEAQHLLDLIALTKDEEDLFYSFAKAAMADVFVGLQMYIPEREKAYLWREGRHTVKIGRLPQATPLVTSDIDVNDNRLQGDLEFAYEGSDPTIHGMEVKVKLRYTVWKMVSEIGMHIQVQREIELTLYCDWDEEREIWVCHIDEEIDTVSEEQILSVDEVEVVDISPYWQDPVEWNEGDWIEKDGEVYIATVAGNANDSEDKLMPTVDYRESIHYIIEYPYGKSLSLAEPLDTTIEEALIARILFKWLQYAYPDEVERYLAEYNEAMEQVRRRCSLFAGVQIVNRIPRMM